MTDGPPPTDADLRLALARALEQMRLHGVQMTEHAKELTEFVVALHARVSGTEAVAAVVDENATQVLTDREVAAQKELISHLYEKSQQYVTVVVAGAFAAYFATLSTVSDRFSNSELRLSALLMTVSLTIFVLWEVFNVAYVGWQSLRGNFGTKEVSRWYQVLWPVVLAASLLTAMPAVGFSLYTYTSGLFLAPQHADTVTRPPPSARKAQASGL